MTKVENEKYAYVTRTSINNGILQYTGFVNQENLNEANIFSLGLLQMNFFYQKRRWYAGQFIRKVIPKFEINDELAIYFGAILNKQQNLLLSVLVREVDKTFNTIEIYLPAYNNEEIAFDYMAEYIKELEAERIKELEAYLIATGLNDQTLTNTEKQLVFEFSNQGSIRVGTFKVRELFSHIVQGRRLKKDDQLVGELPFVMAGTTDTGIANYVSNNVKIFPANSLTVDIFGNVFYRNYEYGMGDDTGAYWNSDNHISKYGLLFIGASLEKSLAGQYDYGHKLRSSKSLDKTVKLPIKSDGTPDFEKMNAYIRAIEKLVIKDVVHWKDKQIDTTKKVVNKPGSVKKFEHKNIEQRGGNYEGL